MIKKLHHIWRQHPIAVVILLLALVASFAFGMYGMKHMHPKGHPDDVVESWMTPGFIAQHWRISREDLIETLDVERPDKDHGPMNLRALARYNEMDAKELIERAQDMIDAELHERTDD